MTYHSIPEQLQRAAEFQAEDRARREHTTCIVYYLPGWTRAWVRTEAEGKDEIPPEALTWFHYNGGK